MRGGGGQNQQSRGGTEKVVQVLLYYSIRELEPDSTFSSTVYVLIPWTVRAGCYHWASLSLIDLKTLCKWMLLRVFMTCLECHPLMSQCGGVLSGHFCLHTLFIKGPKMRYNITNSSVVSIPPNDERVTANKLLAVSGWHYNFRLKEGSLDTRAVNKHASSFVL